MIRTLWSRFNIKWVLAWYDLWFGIFIDTKKQLIYFLPIPIIGIKFSYLPILDFLWWITPISVGTYVSKKTGYIWGRREDTNYHQSITYYIDSSKGSDR